MDQDMKKIREAWVAAGLDGNVDDQTILNELHKVLPPMLGSGIEAPTPANIVTVLDIAIKAAAKKMETAGSTVTPPIPSSAPSNPGETQEHQGEDSSKTTKKRAKAVRPNVTSNLSSSMLSAIDARINAQLGSKEAVSARSHIERLIIDRPAMSEYVASTATFVFDGDVEAFIKKHASAVIEEDREKFDDLCAKLRNKTPLAVNITTSRKVIGYEILAPHMTEGREEMVTSYYSKDTAVSFVATETAGYISPREEGDLSARLAFRFNKSETVGKASVEISTGRPWLRVANQKDNLAKPDRVLVSARATAEMCEGRVRSAICFRKDTGKTYSDGKKRYVTVRVPGKIQVPVFERVDTKLEQLFPLSSKTYRLNNTARSDIRNAMSLAMQWFASDPNRAYSFGVTDEIDELNKEALARSATAGDF